ncbi:hypothetical protein FKM82_020859 [Ascaphus truei]
MAADEGDVIMVEPDMCMDELEREAETFKEHGNMLYSKKDYSQAYSYYTQAIAMRSAGARTPDVTATTLGSKGLRRGD